MSGGGSDYAKAVTYGAMDMGGGNGGGAETAPTLTRTQQKVAKAFGRGYMLPRIGEGLPLYQGPLYEPMPEAEVATLRGYEPTMQGLLPGVAEAFQTAMAGVPTAGYSPGEIDRYLAGQRGAAELRFEEETIPEIRGAYRGPGTYWGGVRAKAEERARTGFETEMTAAEEAARLQMRERGMGLEEAAKQRQLQAAQGA